MTDEEMAEEWLDERYLKDMGVRKPCKEAFLAGFKAGKPRWHDLRKDPYDLPKHTRYVWTNVEPSYYDVDRDCPCWRDEFGITQCIIAWCEPKYTEE